MGIELEGYLTLGAVGIYRAMHLPGLGEPGGSQKGFVLVLAQGVMRRTPDIKETAVTFDVASSCCC